MGHISYWSMLMMVMYWVNTEAVSNTNNEFGLKVNTEKTKHMFMPHHQNTG